MIRRGGQQAGAAAVGVAAMRRASVAGAAAPALARVALLPRWKGAEAVSEVGGPRAGRGIHTWHSISTSGVTRGEDQISWDLVEAAAAERIARHTREGKPRMVLAGNERLSARKQRFSVIFEGIPRRKSLALSGSRPERIHFTDRIITDEFVPEEDCQRLVAACEAAVRSEAFIPLKEQGEVSFTPLQPVCEELVGAFAYRILLSALEKMRLEVQHDYHTPELHFAGALLSRLAPPPGLAPGQAPPPNNAAYWNPHIDKANKRAYDFSAILYLNSQGGCTRNPPAGPAAAAAGGGGGAGAKACSGLDYGINGAGSSAAAASSEAAPQSPPAADAAGGGGFLGGEFTFLDADADRTVSPIAGRMVSFTSGFENPHQVLPVTGGRRYALSVWFTTDPANAYQVV